MRVLHHQAAHRRAPHVHVEDPTAQFGRRPEAVVLESGVGEALADRILTVAALVHGHAPARIVLLGLPNHRVVRVEQLVPQRDGLGGYAAKNAAHGGENPSLTA